MPKPKTLVDTSVWVDFLRGSRAAHVAEAERLVRTGRAATCGLVRAELLAGVRTAPERQLVAQGLDGLDYYEMTEPVWTRTGELSATLRAKGKTIPLSDCLLASLALENGCSILTTDTHFHNIPALTLHTF